MASMQRNPLVCVAEHPCNASSGVVPCNASSGVVHTKKLFAIDPWAENRVAKGSTLGPSYSSSCLALTNTFAQDVWGSLGLELTAGTFWKLRVWS